jgi:glycosyltransferase involved in cell wall biosynthesis
MHGTGTTQTASVADTFILDVSRTVRRIGRGPATGIDRVERAYLRHLLNSGDTAFFLARISRGYCLWDQSGMLGLLDMAKEPAGAELQQSALVSCGLLGLAGMVRARVPRRFEYLNVGHSNIRWPVLHALRRAGADCVTIMVHDMIPLDHPELTRPEVPGRFARAMRLAGRRSDRIIYNSQHTRQRAEFWFDIWGLKPQGRVVPLGIDPPAALSPTALAAVPAAPYFVVLGTIEPRKNHALLLDIWEGFERSLPADRIPHLHIIGRRGWLNRDVFARLDASPFIGVTVHEHGALDDNRVQALVTGARALLFPTLAEGFGLPLAEAMQLGTAAICSDLPVFRDLFGDYPDYLPINDRTAWAQKILGLAKTSGFDHDSHNKKIIPPLPDWAHHFAQVLEKQKTGGNKCGQRSDDVEGSTTGIYPAAGTQAQAAARNPQEQRAQPGPQSYRFDQTR